MSGARIERRLAAILAADVVGYSRLMEQDEAATLARLRTHRRELIDPKIAEHKGRIVKTTGDGILIEFPSVVEAVACAVAVQRGMAERNVLIPEDRQIVFRVGVNLGDIIVEDGDIHGDGVNVAARLEAISEPGGICLSGTVRDHIGDRLDLAFDDLGEQALKNIARPVRVYAVRLANVSRTPTVSRADSQTVLALPDKPSIAVLPFQNMTGDPEQEYFADGMVEDIITELSRFRALFVIARNSTFTYKGKAVDVRHVARELGVRYVVEGSIRRYGDRVRVTAQLIDAATGNHIWADRYDRTLEDVFAVQEDVTRSIVGAVAPAIELAEVTHARRASPGSDAVQLMWRARGLYNDAIQRGEASLMMEAIAVAEHAIAADPTSLAALNVLVSCHRMRHLYRWGPELGKALDAAWAAVERMRQIDALDERTLAQSGGARIVSGEEERGIAELHRAIAVNPNSIQALRSLAYAEARVGLVAEAKEHALAALRVSPRDNWIGAIQLCLAMANYTGHDYAEAVRWAELAIQSQPRAPIRRSIMVACYARAGDLQKAARERAVLDSFAPDFIPSLFRGENPVFTRKQDLEHLLEGLRLAGAETE